MPQQHCRTKIQFVKVPTRTHEYSLTHPHRTHTQDVIRVWGTTKNPVRDAAIPMKKTENTQYNENNKDGKSDSIEIITPQWECDATQAKVKQV